MGNWSAYSSRGSIGVRLRFETQAGYNHNHGVNVFKRKNKTPQREKVTVYIGVESTGTVRLNSNGKWVAKAKMKPVLRRDPDGPFVEVKTAGRLVISGEWSSKWVEWHETGVLHTVDGDVYHVDPEVAAVWAELIEPYETTFGSWVTSTADALEVLQERSQANFREREAFWAIIQSLIVKDEPLGSLLTTPIDMERDVT